MEVERKAGPMVRQTRYLCPISKWPTWIRGKVNWVKVYQEGVTNEWIRMHLQASDIS